MSNNFRPVIDENTPTQALNTLWEDLKLDKINALTLSAKKLMDKFSELYCNGSIKMNKYKIVEATLFNYLLQDKNFIQNMYKNKIILQDTVYSYYDLNEELLKINIKEHYTGIHALSDELARIMGYNGAYTKGTEQKETLKIVAEFIESEFEKRFEDFDYHKVEIKYSKWFYDVIWDYSYIITDNKKHEILFIDITETD
jgi:predicted translin family RNA/ssDNA-binding protein